jgi:molecular chaperone GrpE
MDRSNEVAQSAEAQGDGAPENQVRQPDSNDISESSDRTTLVTQQFRELEDRYLRLAAEFDNFRKRSRRESAEWGSRAQAELVKQLLDPLDDLTRFAHVDPASTDAATVVQGVDMVERKMFKALGAAGLELLNPVDEQFDPELHEAVMTEPAASPEDDHMIARVFQLGYRFAGQLLRPAMVVVKQWND